MAKKNVCVSFDFENDGYYRNLLSAWDANSNFEFNFNDVTPSEINSNDISRIKAGLTRRINQCKYLLVIVGKYANQQHKDHEEIGEKNWINWEIKKAKELNKKLVAVKINYTYESPEQLYNSGATWAMSFTQDKIIKALNDASNQ